MLTDGGDGKTQLKERCRHPTGQYSSIKTCLYRFTFDDDDGGEGGGDSGGDDVCDNILHFSMSQGRNSSVREYI